MIKKILITFLSIILFSLSGNCVFAKKLSSQLELRTIETHFYDTADTDRVIKAVVNTLQDSGFVIQEIEPELGYLRAQKTFKKRHINKSRLAGQSCLFALAATYTVFSYGSTAYLVAPPTRKISNELHQKTIVIDSNVDIEKYGKNKTKVRLVLVEKVLQNADGYSYMKSAPLRAFRIYKPSIFQEFFAQVDKSIFYEGI